MEEFNFTKSQLETLRNFVLFPNDFKYPIGTILVTDDETFNPAVEYGGGWAQIKDKFLLGAGDTYNAVKGNLNGGEATHKLTTSEMPSHYHNYYAASYSDTENLSKNYGYNNSNFKENGIFVTNYTNYGKGYGGKQMIQNTGGNGSHNNMPPYTAKYIWIKTTLEADS